MIKEAYVSFEVAKLLKEKGFNEPCDNYYDQSSDEPQQLTLDEMYYSYDEFTKAPTHQMAMAWLREVYNVFIYVEPFITTNGLQGYKPYCTKIGGEFMWINPLRKYSNTSSDTYYEAVEAALKYSLENLI